MSVLSIAFLCLFILPFAYINSQSGPYDSTCNCTSISSNEIDDHGNITTSLFISSNHLIFLGNDTELKSAIFASQLHLGDHIKYIYKNEIIAAEIQNIYLTIEAGYYALLVPSGTIIIDNTLVLYYISVKIII
ncbi:unnamed protein product [Rotaria sp. Silwood1]|nr:unnamed protein product [Rotaria sp. Silwood1]CAF3528280.1 unnamed protein product [Rotaria sp. Silwood1]CAF3593624.1 unnamed protein product [Rotaria sp. Silwood1]CAF3596635.1 unnamed protein product [Rotaria sp. Silwood1]CAF3607993.1 unnamed protein product [Rotaria sp. Silwood1]